MIVFKIIMLVYYILLPVCSYFYLKKTQGTFKRTDPWKSQSNFFMKTKYPLATLYRKIPFYLLDNGNKRFGSMTTWFKLEWNDIKKKTCKGTLPSGNSSKNLINENMFVLFVYHFYELFFSKSSYKYFLVERVYDWYEN